MDIRGDHKRMSDAGNKLADEIYRQYADLVKKIFDEIDTLRTKWVGIDQTSFIKNILSKKPSLDNLGKVINDYGNFLTESASFIGQAQGEIADAAANL